MNKELLREMTEIVAETVKFHQTDFAYDIEEINANAGKSFVWGLDKYGTDIWFEGSEWYRFEANIYPKTKWYVWDGKTLREVTLEAAKNHFNIEGLKKASKKTNYRFPKTLNSWETGPGGWPE